MKQKMSGIILFVVAHLMLHSCSSSPTILDRFNLKGPVKKMTVEQFTAIENDGEWKKGEISDYGNYIMKFDRKGNLENMEYTNADGETRMELIPEYEDGEIAEEIMYNKEGKEISHTKFNRISEEELRFKGYNTKGERVNKGKSIFEDNLIVKQEFEDNYGNELKTHFKYNRNGELTEQKQVDAEGEIIFHALFEIIEYDKKKNWIKALQFDMDNEDEPVFIIVREFDYY